MKVLLIDSSYPINNRNTKILNSLGSKFGNRMEILVCAWNRDGRGLDMNEEFQLHIFHKKASYGSQIKKILGFGPYLNFIRKINFENKPDIIVASHWDMLALASIIKLDNQKLIYENLDIPTASNFLFRKIFSTIERLALRKSDAIIFASRFFEDKYANIKKRKIVLENLPFRDVVIRTNFHTYQSNKLKVSFIGTLRYFEVMKNLINGVKDLPVEILFWGDGPDFNSLKEYSISNSAVKFFGKYEYKTISDIYALSDVVWAVYPSLDYNVKYAISNKFYECLLFGKPGVFAKGTMLGDLVEDKEIGYTVNPYSSDDITALFESIINNPNEIARIKNGLINSEEKKNWEDEENGLVKFFLELQQDSICTNVVNKEKIIK